MKRKLKNNKGITLIALVVTIVVLLILAGVSISMLTGENGIITRAEQSKLQTEIGKEKEEVNLAYTSAKSNKENFNDLVTDTEMNEELAKLNSTGTASGSGTLTVTFENGHKYTIDQGTGAIAGPETDEETKTTDGVTIPKGFYYVGGKKESGVVISDEPIDENKYKDKDIVGTNLIGNQYVWIPVDGILGEDNTTIEDVVNEDNTINKVLLGRYTINNTATGRLLDESTSTTYLEETPEEHAISGYQNTIAVDIEEFKKSVKENKGYYIARFEASEGENGKAESKYDKEVWRGLTQPVAAEKCINLYATIKSDLTNGYAWDTAIAFIQKYSGDTNYSGQKSLQSSLANTGKANNGSEFDVRCNIFDMAGNCWEYTTETSCKYKELDGGYPSVARGNHYYEPEHGYSPSYTIDRDAINNSNRITNTVIRSYGSFRSILYF